MSEGTILDRLVPRQRESAPFSLDELEKLKAHIRDQQLMLCMIAWASVGRCMCCGWPISESSNRGCVPGDCSFRPSEGDESYGLWKARTEILVAARKSFAR